MMFFKNHNRNLYNYLLFTVLVILITPIVIYSVKTGFATVDDYTDWRHIVLLEDSSAGWGFLRRNFIEFIPGDRYRPFFQIWLAITWKTFGANASLHHLMRLLFKFLTVALLAGSFLRLFTSSKRVAAAWSLSFCLLFFPNNPEARLSPQECNLALFTALSWCLFAHFNLFKKRTLSDLSNPEFGILLLSHFLISISKETNLGILAAQTIFLITIAGKPNPRCLLRLLSFCTVSIYTAIKIAHGNATGAEKSTRLELLKIFTNWDDTVTYSGLADIFKVLVVILLATLLVHFRSGKKTPLIADFNNYRRFYVLFGLAYIFTFTLTLELGVVYLRYAHPLFVLNAVGCGLAVGLCWDKIRGSRLSRFLTYSSVAWFVLANYDNFIFQFSHQHALRKIDTKVIQRIETLSTPENPLLIIGRGEEETKLVTYALEFSTRFREKKIPILYCETLSLCPALDKKPQLILTREEHPSGYATIERIWPTTSDEVTRFTHKISRLLRYPRRIDRFTDSGAPPISVYLWHVLQKPSST